MPRRRCARHASVCRHIRRAPRSPAAPQKQQHGKGAYIQTAASLPAPSAGGSSSGNESPSLLPGMASDTGVARSTADRGAPEAATARGNGETTNKSHASASPPPNRKYKQGREAGSTAARSEDDSGARAGMAPAAASATPSSQTNYTMIESMPAKGRAMERKRMMQELKEASDGKADALRRRSMFRRRDRSSGSKSDMEFFANGMPLTRVFIKSRPQTADFRYKEESGLWVWRVAGQVAYADSVDMREVREVRLGLKSKEFEKNASYKPDMALVVLFGNEFRLKTLSLVASSKKECEFVVCRLRELAEQVQGDSDLQQRKRWLWKEFTLLDPNDNGVIGIKELTTFFARANIKAKKERIRETMRVRRCGAGAATVAGRCGRRVGREGGGRGGDRDRLATLQCADAGHSHVAPRRHRRLRRRRSVRWPLCGCEMTRAPRARSAGCGHGRHGIHFVFRPRKYRCSAVTAAVSIQRHLPQLRVGQRWRCHATGSLSAVPAQRTG